MTHRPVKSPVNCVNQNSTTVDKLRIAELVVDDHLLAIKLPAITKGLVDNRNHCPQLSVNTQRKKEELLQLTHKKQWINQPIMTQESDNRKDRKKVSSSIKQKPSALLPIKEWEEQYQRNMHQQKLIKAKAAVDTKSPKTLPLIRDNRTKV